MNKQSKMLYTFFWLVATSVVLVAFLLLKERFPRDLVVIFFIVVWCTASIFVGAMIDYIISLFDRR